MRFALIIVLLVIMISGGHAIQPEIGLHTFIYPADGSTFSSTSQVNLITYDLAIQGILLTDVYVSYTLDANITINKGSEIAEISIV